MGMYLSAELSMGYRTFCATAKSFGLPSGTLHDVCLVLSHKEAEQWEKTADTISLDKYSRDDVYRLMRVVLMIGALRSEWQGSEDQFEAVFI